MISRIFGFWIFSDTKSHREDFWVKRFVRQEKNGTANQAVSGLVILVNGTLQGGCHLHFRLVWPERRHLFCPDHLVNWLKWGPSWPAEYNQKFFSIGFHFFCFPCFELIVESNMDTCWLILFPFFFCFCLDFVAIFLNCPPCACAR